MKTVYLGKETVQTIADVHTLFAESFGFPEWYGNNLDALYDCLTDLTEPSLVVIADAEILRDRLGERYDALRMLLDDAHENPNVRVREFPSPALV